MGASLQTPQLAALEANKQVVGWSNSVAEPSFGGGNNADTSIKSKLVNLMTSVRTLMRSTLFFFLLIPALRGLMGKSCGGRKGAAAGGINEGKCAKKKGARISWKQRTRLRKMENGT